ncbi:hypothetical protein O3G_MSEX012227 [Manduca sexta]|uniref:Gustatory receptor 40 n=1 Tax=Manduca sexta TaxID=7130 RepID=A0A5K8B1T9_MANSE|nr:hypothetical protein O3G_MSEX012227 [Manduca sexta]CUQ99380.1 TPA: Gustatory receptor 40 [Manduca sexta]
MTDQLACNIDFYLYTRFIFGFYHEFQTYKPVRWLARGFCGLMSTCIIFFYDSFFIRSLNAVFIMYLQNIEYVLYVLISLLKGNDHLIHFYKKTPLIETRATNYTPTRVRLMVYICLMFLIRSFGVIKTIFIHRDKSVTEHHFAIIDFIMWFTMLLGRSPLLFVFALLYSRVRVMRQTLESNDFDCRILSKHHPRQYIQTYEAIMDRLDENTNSMKLQVLHRYDLCPDERDRVEIQKLSQMMRSRPINFTLCGVVSLNVRSVFSFISFTLTTFIAILQTKQWST